MRRVWVLAAALCAVPARAGEPATAVDPRLYAEPSADTSPTGWACTVETLASGAECVFESEAPAAGDAARQAVENAAAAAKLGDGLCAKAARHPYDPIPDPDVLSACRRSFTERAMACGADGTRPLLDAEGRFGAEFRVCYAALGGVLARARTMASTAAPCCRCLVASRCVTSGERCNADAISQTLDGPVARCAEQSCFDSCRAQLPLPPPPPAPPQEARPPVPVVPRPVLLVPSVAPASPEMPCAKP